MRIRIDHLRKSFGEKTALDLPGFDCSFPHCLALVGPSGGGKSTLLRVLGGLEFPDCGTVEVNGKTLQWDENSLRAHHRQVGTVFQSFNLFPHLTSLENIVLPLRRAHGIPPREAEDRARELLRRFGLATHADHPPSKLSGGQRQRVAIARAVAIRPSFLLMDEPTSALDPEMTAEVLDLLRELRTENCPLVLVTHEMGFAKEAADLVAFVENGTISACTSGEEFFSRPPTPTIARFLSSIL